MNKSPLISIIIANFNGEKYLKVCLESVIKTKYKFFEIILVDDGSTDKSIEIIKKFKSKDKRIVLSKNEKNLGAAASRNKAAKMARGEILVFLDNDTEVDSGWLSEMVNTLNRDIKIGGCQALLMDYKKRKTIQVAGTKIWAATGWGLPIGKGEENKGQFGEINIIALSAALAVRKKVFDKVRGFDELEAVVTEDLDLSWRIWIAGYKVVLSPKAIVYHWTKSVAMRKNMKHTNEKIYFHLTKNSLISIMKNYEKVNTYKYVLEFLLISVVRALLVLVKKGDFSSLIGTYNGVLYVLRKYYSILEDRSTIQGIRVYGDRELFDIILFRDYFFRVYNQFYMENK